VRHRDHEALARVKGIHKGQRCFLIGTGPSLNRIDRKLIMELAHEHTFGVNYLVSLDWWPFMPTYIAAAELDHLERIQHHVEAAESRFRLTASLWFSNHYCPTEFPRWNWLYRDHWARMQDGAFNGFGEELDWVAEGECSTFDCALPLACWMGFNQVYLVGCDNTRTGYAYDLTAPRADRPDSVIRAALVARAKMEEQFVLLGDCCREGSLPLPKHPLKELLVGRK